MSLNWRAALGRRLASAMLAVGGAALALAPLASASHDVPKKAKKHDYSLVATYIPCNSQDPANTPSIEDPVLGPNTACPAALREPDAKFGPAAQGSYKTKLSGGDISLKLKIKDLLDGGSPYSGDLESTWAGNPSHPGMYRFQYTDADCGGSHCTLNLLYASIGKAAGDPPVCSGGNCSLSTGYNQVAVNLDPYPIYMYESASTTPPNTLVKEGKQESIEQSAPCFGKVPPAQTFPGSGVKTIVCRGLLLGSPASSEPAGYSRPRKANKISLEYVRAFEPDCGGAFFTLPHSLPFDPSLVGGCEPVTTFSTLNWGPAGRGSLKLKPKTFNGKGEINVKGKLLDVRNADSSPYSGTLSLRFSVRVTHAQCGGGATVCTRPDRTLSLSTSCANGTCKISGTTGDQFGAASSLDLPTTGASNVAVAAPARFDIDYLGELCFYDEGDKPFACPGTFVP